MMGCSDPLLRAPGQIRKWIQFRILYFYHIPGPSNCTYMFPLLANRNRNHTWKVQVGILESRIGGPAFAFVDPPRDQGWLRGFETPS